MKRTANKKHTSSHISIIKAYAWIILSLLLISSFSINFFDYHPFRDQIEEKLLLEAKMRISRVRKGTIILDFGIGNASMNVYIHQIRHSFRFGSNCYQFNYFPSEELNQKYNKSFTALFNYATLPFYWKLYEPEENNYDYLDRLHNMTAWLNNSNIISKGHPIVWQFDDVTPDWMYNKTFLEQKNKTLSHIEQILTNFPEIKIWDLCNELIHVNNSWLGNTPKETWISALKKAKSIRNDSEFIINDYNILGSGNPLGNIGDSAIYYQLIKEIVDEGYPPDAIGMQFHSMDKCFPSPEILNALDDFADFKIPIHITEFIPASKGFYIGGIKRGIITQETQADYAEKIYTLLFSHPAVYAITWWDFSTNDRWKAWQEDLGGYMMDKEGNILPVYERLYNLIHKEWNSTQNATLNENGRIEFTGFYGDYYISINGSEPIYFSIEDTRDLSSRPWKIADLI
ncbi:MAG: endo-1,4-beta-xylanase [Promethearchaeota archaeon]